MGHGDVPDEPIDVSPSLPVHRARGRLELAPLLAEEGIDVDNIDVPDLATLQAAMSRAIERHNMAMFTPVGQARDWAVTALRLAVEAIADGNTALAGSILEQVQPESKDNSTPTTSSYWPARAGRSGRWTR